MKSRIVILTALLMLIVSAAYAAEIQAAGTPLRKLQRGFLNIVFSPIEISNELDKVKKTESALPSWFEGMGRGVCFTAGRALVGVYEVVTFPVPLPSGYEPVIEPEFAWEHLPPAEEVPASGRH